MVKQNEVVNVYNLSTEDWYFYTNITAEKAVFYAFQSSIGNSNTWDYDELFESHKEKLKYGQWHVFYGNFAARF